MNKKKIAAVAAAITYINTEKNKQAQKRMKKKAYESHCCFHDNEWQGYGIRSMMHGRKIKQEK